MAVVFPDSPCFTEALFCGRGFARRGGGQANDALRCLHRPLEGLAISSGAAAVPGSDAARGDALDGAPIEDSFDRHGKRLESAHVEGASKVFSSSGREEAGRASLLFLPL